MHESDKTQYSFFKYGIILFGIIILGVFVIFLLDPDAKITINDVEQEASLFYVWPFLGIALALIAFGFLLWKKLRIAKLDNATIELHGSGTPTSKNWDEVEKISLFQVVMPPLYRIQFKDEDKTYWFFTHNKFIYLPFYVRDLSEMGGIIKRKKEEYQL